MPLTVTTTPFTVDTDQTPTTGIAVRYDADEIAVTIANNIVVMAIAEDAIFSTHAGSTLINNGYVFSAQFLGVSFGGANSTIVNNAGHSIGGVGIGIDYNGNGATLTDHGTVLRSTA
jgi:hypothetical protein